MGISRDLASATRPPRSSTYLVRGLLHFCEIEEVDRCHRSSSFESGSTWATAVSFANRDDFRIGPRRVQRPDPKIPVFGDRSYRKRRRLVFLLIVSLVVVAVVLVALTQIANGSAEALIPSLTSTTL